MLNGEVYAGYLASTRRNEKAVKDSMKQFENLQGFIDKCGLKGLSDFSQDIIHAHIRPDNADNRRGEIEKANKFMLDYATSIEKGFTGADEQGYIHIAKEIRAYYKKQFEDTAIKHAMQCKAKFLPLPGDFKVNPLVLHGLSNEQFVAAFKALHQLMKDIYDDIIKSPFEWGYPDFLTTEGYYDRVNDMLLSFFSCGSYKDGCIHVDAVNFFVSKRVKQHKKTELMIHGFKRMGFDIVGYEKKAVEFHVSYPAQPHIISAFCAYVPAAFNMSLPVWSAKNRLGEGFSYRFIEDPAVQEFEPDFHAYTDCFSDEYMEIQRWLRSEAAKYGFYVSPNDVTTKGCLSYTKGSKQFLLVGEKGGKIWSKTSFIKAFEEAPEQMQKLCDRFPHVFRLEDAGKCCSDKPAHARKDGNCTFSMRFNFNGIDYIRCGLNNFIFNDLSLDDVKAILEMFKIENKIK